ncbi:MAG: response regulator [Myxococcales bacterium]|nr:response regulator [Myxococcales bacterium]
MGKVLVVDDNKELANDLVEILTAEGHQARAAYGGQHALETAEQYEYDAALVDIRMPDMDGVALVGKLMKTHPTQAYLFMTAYSESRTLSEAMALSTRAVLEKPLDIARVCRLVSAAC